MCIALSDGALSALCVKRISRVSKQRDKEGGQQCYHDTVLNLSLCGQQADGYTKRQLLTTTAPCYFLNMLLHSLELETD